MDWKSVVGSVAPVLAGALGGGPIGAAAVKVLADKLLGKPDASQDEVIEALSSGSLTGDQIIALKQAEQSWLLEMERIDAAREESYLKDVQDARGRQVATKDYIPQIILFTLFAFWAGTMALFWFADLPSDEFLRALITRAYATVETGLTGAIAYFIGSSRGSKSSGDTVRAIAAGKK